MNARARAALVSICSLFLLTRGTPVHAQALLDTAAATRSTMPAVATPHVGPTRDAAAVAVHAPSLPMNAVAPARGSAGVGQPEALMIVGGAAILVGAVIGGDAGDIFMIGGAVVGLVGLYKYLQ
jgi:hypothetical protein